MNLIYKQRDNVQRPQRTKPSRPAVWSSSDSFIVGCNREQCKCVMCYTLNVHAPEGKCISHSLPYNIVTLKITEILHMQSHVWQLLHHFNQSLGQTYQVQFSRGPAHHISKLHICFVPRQVAKLHWLGDSLCLLSLLFSRDINACQAFVLCVTCTSLGNR